MLMPETMPAKGVCAPEATLMAERLRPPPTGIPPLKVAAIFAAPSPSSSWLASMRSRRWVANACAMVMPCTMPIKAIRKVGPTNALKTDGWGIEKSKDAHSRDTGPTTAMRWPGSRASPCTTQGQTSINNNGNKRCHIGQRFRPVRAKAKATTAPTPSRRVGTWISGSQAQRLCKSCQLVFTRASIPPMNRSWLKMMSSAEPVINPLTTGLLSSWDKNPKRASPHNVISTPEPRLSHTAS